MAEDSVELDNLQAGDDVATDLVTSKHYQYVKMAFGADGTITKVGTTASDPLPVALSDIDNAVLDNILTAVQLIDNAIAGSEMQVDIVSGTVTANLSATDNAVLDQIDSNTDFGAVTGGGTETGALRVTLANDSTGLVSVDDGGGSITVDGSVTVSGTVTANAGSGTMTVDLGANNDVTIDNSSIVHAEDAAHGSGDAGIMPLAVRNDDLAALAGADGDYAPLQVTQNGALLTCPAANDDYKYAVIDDATSGDNTLVAAVASRKIRVLALFMVSAGTVNARFEDGAAGTALTGQMNLVANSGFTLPFNPAGWFETSVNTLLNLELSAAVSVDGSITYIEVP